MRGWHGGGSSNNSYIGVEICEDGLEDATYFNKVYNEAVELVAMLAKQYNWEINSNTVLCHSEGYKKGIASNHADVMHWFPKFGKSMDTFRADVKAKMNTVTPTPTPTPTGYLVKINTAVLNVRDGAGTSYKVNTTVKRNEVFTIVDEKMNGKTKWGKLKSKAGWISLGYTIKLNK
jgi:N-acetylmuramoyl-L-alanine amidase CwlA